MSMRTKWTTADDNALRSAVEHVQSETGEVGTVRANWEIIAMILDQQRTARQCKDRWQTVLDPSLNRGPWTAQEDDIFFQGLQTHGKKWANIARMIPGRTVSAIKNRYVSFVRKGRTKPSRTSTAPVHTPPVVDDSSNKAESQHNATRKRGLSGAAAVAICNLVSPPPPKPDHVRGSQSQDFRPAVVSTRTAAPTITLPSLSQLLTAIRVQLREDALSVCWEL
eukprot:c27395_g1_i1.p1 GENE.c27395_g1_i1~~c27395_g1_i1.p1  ORF type:complete len:223 (+),score=19.11 c27395_g1_i1:35-703(+)